MKSRPACPRIRSLRQIATNALRDGGNVPVSVRARERWSRPDPCRRPGPGIPLVEQDRIFAPFYHAPGAVGRGSGLGLAIVRGFVEANGGRVRVESLPGQGTSLVVELPLPEGAPLAGEPA